MAVSIVVGGQFGSEGKGKVAYFFAKEWNASAIVRVGGTNSGHTVISDKGQEYILRSLPTGSIDPSFTCILPSGAYIDLDILFAEIELTGLHAENLKIDRHAVIIEERMKKMEEEDNLRQTIGSTLSGTGAAVSLRAARESDLRFAQKEECLKPFICDTKKLMRTMLNDRKNIIIEGTQGFGLSPLNSIYYPHCTSRDTTAASFAAEAGLSPLDVENIVMVIRSYPIRVGGNSGPIPNETNWESIAESAGAGCDLTEYTSATKRVRRVAEFDAEIVRQAIQVNRPNIIVMNHLDYIDYSCHDHEIMSESIQRFVGDIEKAIGQDIDFIGSGKSILVENGRR